MKNWPIALSACVSVASVVLGFCWRSGWGYSALPSALIIGGLVWLVAGTPWVARVVWRRQTPELPIDYPPGGDV